MKNMFVYQRIWRVVSLLVVGSISQACNPDFLQSDAGKNTPNEGVLTMSYEAEMLTYQPLGGDGKAPTPDRIAAMAKSARTRISVEVYEDGTSDWTMETLAPKQNTLMRDLTPPDPSPQTKKTHILRDGMGYFYDAGGKLLHKDPVPVQSFTPMLVQIKQDRTAANAIIGVKSEQEVTAMIANAKAQGGIVQDLGNGNISIRNMVLTMNRNARGGIADMKQVDIVNGRLGIVVGSSLYDGGDQLVCQTFYKYKKENNKNKLIPETIYSKSWHVNPRTNQRVETITNTEFENIVVKTKKA